MAEAIRQDLTNDGNVQLLLAFMVASGIALAIFDYRFPLILNASVSGSFPVLNVSMAPRPVAEQPQPKLTAMRRPPERAPAAIESIATLKPGKKVRETVARQSLAQLPVNEEEVAAPAEVPLVPEAATVDVQQQMSPPGFTPPSSDAAYLKNPTPFYPELARRRGMEGVVRLLVSVRRDGSVDKVLVSHSSGHKVLDAAALNSVKRWRFTPASEDGNPVAATIEVPIRFSLNSGRG